MAARLEALEKSHQKGLEKMDQTGTANVSRDRHPGLVKDQAAKGQGQGGAAGSLVNFFNRAISCQRSEKKGQPQKVDFFL